MPAARAALAQRGLSIVEIMVAMAIGLFIVLIVATIYIESSSNFNFRMGQSENLGNSRYALGTLDSQFGKAGYRRDPTQAMQDAFPADSTANPNGCEFAASQAIKVNADGALCIRFQPRDKDETDCSGATGDIAALIAYEAPVAPETGKGILVEKYALKKVNGKDSLVCLGGKEDASTADGNAVAEGVRGIHYEFGVDDIPGDYDDSQGERRVEKYETTTPGAGEVIRSLRYAVLLASTAKNITAGMGTTVCTRWAGLGGTTGDCDPSQGQLYQISSGSLTLRNLVP